MSSQSVFGSNGIKSRPANHYSEHRCAYEYIDSRLRKTRSAVHTSDKQTVKRAVRDSIEYAIISVQTHVDRHEPAFVETRDDDLSRDEIADRLESHAVQYYNNKARYIDENRSTVDFGEIAGRVMVDDIDGAHELIMDCLGVGAAKAAFSLSMLGFDSKMCLDSHTLRMAEMNNRSADGVSMKEYNEICGKVMEKFDDIDGQLSPFLYQWLLFDTDRGFVEMHDPFYIHMESIFGNNIL